MKGGKLGEVRKEGVKVGYSDESPSYRVCVKIKVLNVWGAEFDDEVGLGWWRHKEEVGTTLEEDDVVPSSIVLHSHVRSYCHNDFYRKIHFTRAKYFLSSHIVAHTYSMI